MRVLLASPPRLPGGPRGAGARHADRRTSAMGRRDGRRVATFHVKRPAAARSPSRRRGFLVPARTGSHVPPTESGSATSRVRPGSSDPAHPLGRHGAPAEDSRSFTAGRGGWMFHVKRSRVDGQRGAPVDTGSPYRSRVRHVSRETPAPDSPEKAPRTVRSTGRRAGDKLWTTARSPREGLGTTGGQLSGPSSIHRRARATSDRARAPSDRVRPLLIAAGGGSVEGAPDPAVGSAPTHGSVLR